MKQEPTVCGRVRPRSVGGVCPHPAVLPRFLRLYEPMELQHKQENDAYVVQITTCSERRSVHPAAAASGATCWT